MKKKLIALSLAVCCITSAFALSACGGDGNLNDKETQKSQQLTQEEWNAAFENLKTMPNFTFRATETNTIESLSYSTGLIADHQNNIQYYYDARLARTTPDGTELPASTEIQLTINGDEFVTGQSNTSSDIENADWTNGKYYGNARLTSAYMAVRQFLYIITSYNTISIEELYTKFSYNSDSGKYEAIKEYLDMINERSYYEKATYISISFRDNNVYEGEVKAEFDGDQGTYKMSLTDINSTKIEISPELQTKLDALKANKN